MLGVVMVSYPRRQQFRRLLSAARFAGCAAIAAAASTVLAKAGQIGLAVIVGALAAAFAARWLARKRRRYPCGVRPVICIARARWVEPVEGDVLVVSLDRLIPALQGRARLNAVTDACELSSAQGERGVRRVGG